MGTLSSDERLEAIIRDTYRVVYRFALASTYYQYNLSYITAEDIVQEAYECFLGICRHNPAMLYDWDWARQIAYLKTIVHRLSLDYMRNEWLMDRLTLHLDADEEQQDIEDQDAADVGTVALTNETKVSLFKRIQALPERQRLILELKVDGHSHEEIAARLQTSVGAVKTALYRAREVLRTWKREDDQLETAVPQKDGDAMKRGDSILLASIECLQEPYRTVLRLRMVDKLGCEDIGQLLQRSPGTVRSQIFRGKQKLARLQQSNEEKKSSRRNVREDLQAHLRYKGRLCRISKLLSLALLAPS